MKKALVYRYIVALFLSVIVVSSAFAPLAVKAEAEASKDAPLVKIEGLKGCRKEKALYGVKKKVKMWITAYEPKPEQTDSTPRISASGKEVFDGMVATNGLPFGTKIRIPSIFGDRELEVWDRMHPRKKGVLDVFMEDGAIQFGTSFAEVEILEG